MEFLTQLWMPILLSAILVFILSSVIHMVLPIHKSDFQRLKDEDAVVDSLRNLGVSPGMYMFPSCGSMKELNSPEMTAKFKRGPLGWLTIAPAGGFNMGKSLTCWFINLLIVSVLVAYVSWYSLGSGSPFMTVFRITGAAAVLGYSVGYMHDPIWKGGSWFTAYKFMIDGFVYSLGTAFVFGWLWPR